MRTPTHIRAATNGNGAGDAGLHPAASAPATLQDDDRSASAASAVGVLGRWRSMTIGLIFVTVYLSAFHAPRPHHLPVAAVGTSQQARTVSASGLTTTSPAGSR